MTTVNVYEAKSSLSRLIAAAEAGDTIVIARNGKPVAQLGPVPKQAARFPGRMKGRIVISEDFALWTDSDESDWFGDSSDPLAQ